MVAPEVTDINTQPGCFWTILPDMTHSSSLDHYKAMTSSGSTVPLDEHGLGVAHPSDTDIATGYSSDARHVVWLISWVTDINKEPILLEMALTARHNMGS